MAVPLIGRRALLSGAAGGCLLAAGRVHARARIPAGGKLALRLPWPVSTMDPHRLDDPCAAIFGDAVFDTLYAPAGDGFVPALAEGEPEPEGAGLRVRVRAGVKTARERPWSSRDAAASIARARASGARAWLADIPAPRDDGRSLFFATRDAGRLVRALASPLVAMVPAGFTPEAPDGTGPFRFVLRDGAMVLTKNRLAARGPAFLDEIVVRPAASVAASLLAFEAGTDDLGWFERGLHESRAGSKVFDFGGVGWAVLSTGRDAADWDGPGIAQRVCDGVPFARVSDLHLGAPWPTEPAQGWGGPPAQLLVREDAPWLVALASALAATLTRPQHEVTVKTLPAAEVASRKASRAFALCLDVVRSLAPGSFGAAVSLATADHAARASDLVQHPPKMGDVAARTLTRTSRSGIVGEVRVSGGRMPETILAGSGAIDWGSSYRARR